MKFNITVVLCALSFFGFGQDCNYTFLGELKDFHDGTPIVAATIYAKNLDKYFISDELGKFKIEKLCTSTLELKISHVACETRELSFEVTGDQFESIRLEHHIEDLDEVSVKASTGKKETSTGQETVLKSETLKRYSSLSLGDALKEVPGVSSINTGNSIVKPVINGMYGSRLLIMNNNVRMQDQEWGIEHAPSIDINSANNISVIKGSGALAFGGDAVGGVVVLNPTRVILKDTLYGSTLIGGQTNGRGFNITSKLNKSYATGWFANAQGSYKRNGDFEAPDYNLTNTGSESVGFSLNTGRKSFNSGFEVYYSFLNNEIGILGASHIGSVFDLRRAIISGEPTLIEDFSYDINAPKQDITHHLAKVNYYKRFQNFGKINLQYDYQYNQRLEFDIRIGDRRDIPAVDLTLQTHTFSADVNIDKKLDQKFSFGIMGRFQDNFANPDTGVRRLIPDYEKYDFGVYSVMEWQLNDATVFDVGLRYDFNRIDAKKFYLKSRWEDRGYDVDFSDIIIEEFPTQFLTNPVFDYHNISASAGIKYALNERNEILFNYALTSRPPNVSELFSDGLHHSAARFELGDLRFNKEISNRVSASYTYTTSNFNLLTDVFYNRINDYIYLRPFDDILTNRGPFPFWAYEQTNAELFGLDVYARWDFTEKWQFQNKSSIIKGYDLETDLALIDIPAFTTTNEIRYYNPNWSNFSASLKSQWVFEQNEFPNFNYNVEDELTGEQIEIPISNPPPAYHLLHFYSDAIFELGGKKSLNVSLTVNNVLNTTYRDYLNKLRYFADDLGRNIALQLQFNY
ncbi:TonB-dependent receptor [Winogradskyella maritima]|uniref:TonB-dependent receptor n=1 Tax=Winogradskyella maritima TaxID=1517766 RepID=A0ABV8AIA0_9FLAO|nr:TonB-dependent receptor [Winogradskyella maritima]